ncbi:SWIM zinc finger family protein [Paludisphaera rhizosphaerae]|uniref:SWIM zinc finger family protein n=1 Tax=Paludisphaera rhizosphaerae TaxID=2711216 RepID=UPI0013EAA6E8|nr:SWIM zinc finger family protein [Paludisphaera rhizosphaerae]
MSDEPLPPDVPSDEPPAVERTEVHLAYHGASRLTTTEDSARLALAANILRPPARFDGVIKDPIRFREAMSALYAVVASDMRYQPKDRTAYLAYMRMRRESSGLDVWQAQREYFGWLLRNDPLAFVILDPVVTVHPDEVFFEVFSKDEGAYAKLGVDRDCFSSATDPTYGTTNIDFSQSLYQGLQQMRSYRETRLTIGPEGVGLMTKASGEVLEKTIRVPDSWLRGFLQVQSAAALPRDTFALAPIDLYNALRHLRLHADEKGKRRGLRVELMPGQPPRLVLEPWNEVIPTTAAPYKGKSARVARVWGRRRLMLLQRFLPFTEEVDVHLLGSGLPSFWVLRGRGMTLTLGLTGFTSANWSQALNFDLLLPRKAEPGGKSLDAVLEHLNGRWSAGAGELAKATKLSWPALTEALQLGCQQGRIMYDLAADVYRLRPLTDAPLDLGRLEFRDARERVAHDLLVRRGAVEIVSENRIPGSGLELTGRVTVKEDNREYRPKMLLADEGQVTRAECTCSFFRKQGLKAGPCVHLVALRLAHAAREAERASGRAPAEAITAETRAFSRRDAKGEDVYQVTLDRRRLKVRWGRADGDSRLQTLAFDSVDEARAAYLARVADLAARGFLDASAG